MSTEEEMNLLEANGITTPRTATAALPTLFSGLVAEGCRLGGRWSVVGVDDNIEKDIDWSAD